MRGRLVARGRRRAPSLPVLGLYTLITSGRAGARLVPGPGGPVFGVAPSAPEPLSRALRPAQTQQPGPGPPEPLSRALPSPATPTGLPARPAVPKSISLCAWQPGRTATAPCAQPARTRLKAHWAIPRPLEY